MAWTQMIDDMSTRGALAHFTQHQIEATIALLAVVMHADDRVGVLEQHEFEALVEQLPFYKGKGEAAQQVEDAIIKARAAGIDEYKALIDALAVHLPEQADRREVFRMAATMAFADHKLHARESEVLGWLAAAFAIDDADAIIAKLG